MGKSLLDTLYRETNLNTFRKSACDIRKYDTIFQKAVG